MVAESSGGWGPEGLKVLRQLAKVAAGQTSDDSGLALGCLLQSLCIIIRSAKARAVLRRAGTPQEPLEPPTDAAASALAAADA